MLDAVLATEGPVGAKVFIEHAGVPADFAIIAKHEDICHVLPTEVVV